MAQLGLLEAEGFGPPQDAGLLGGPAPPGWTWEQLWAAVNPVGSAEAASIPKAYSVMRTGIPEGLTAEIDRYAGSGGGPAGPGKAPQVHTTSAPPQVPAPAPPPPPPSIKAYHSSPHDFERFDLSKVGTGQGAQSYGHGFYFAESPKVSGQGGQYWQEFSRRFKGPEEQAAMALQAAGFDRNKAIASSRQNIDQLRDQIANTDAAAKEMHWRSAFRQRSYRLQKPQELRMRCWRAASRSARAPTRSS